MNKVFTHGDTAETLVESLRVATTIAANPSSKGRPIIQAVRLIGRESGAGGMELVIVATDSYVLWEEVIGEGIEIEGEPFDVLVEGKEMKRTLTGEHRSFTIEVEGETVTVNGQSIIRTTHGSFPNYEGLFPNYSHDGSAVFALGDPAMRMLSVLTKQGHPVEFKAIDELKPIEIRVATHGREIRALAMPVRIRS